METPIQERDGNDRSISKATQGTDKFLRIYLDNLLNKPGPASDPDWVPGPETINALESSKVLLVRI